MVFKRYLSLLLSITKTTTARSGSQSLFRGPTSGPVVREISSRGSRIPIQSHNVLNIFGRFFIFFQIYWFTLVLTWQFDYIHISVKLDFSITFWLRFEVLLTQVCSISKRFHFHFSDLCVCQSMRKLPALSQVCDTFSFVRAFKSNSLDFGLIAAFALLHLFYRYLADGSTWLLPFQTLEQRETRSRWYKASIALLYSLF